MKIKPKVSKKNKSKKGIIMMVVIILIVLVICIIFLKKNDKTFQFGNNTINKTTEGITEYILNINSYQAKIEVNVNSNKNKTRYQIEQKYISPNLARQVVEEPSNIGGLTAVYDGTNLKIENTNLNLTTIYENYKELTENHLFLNFFIEDYKSFEGSRTDEKDGIIVMQTVSKNSDNKYMVAKKLYIDKNTAKPIKMEVQDVNQNITVYILYNEININSTKTEEITAFKANPILSKI